MKFTGRVRSVNRDWETGQLTIEFTVNERAAEMEIDNIKDLPVLDVEAKKHRKKRSIEANALLWACLGDIAAALRTDKWSVYLIMLKRYGKYTYICVKPKAVEAVKKQWRECEEIGPIYVGGEAYVQMLCYFGSSTYDSKEMSVLIDGVISEMMDIGLQPPLPRDVKAAIEQWGKRYDPTG
jgi:hypothetical protein